MHEIPEGVQLWCIQTFVHQGTNGRWREVLSPAETRKSEDLALERLGPDCATWLATGERADQPD